MADFTGERDRVVRLRRSMAEVFAKFTDPEARARCMPDLIRKEKVDDKTYRWIMKEDGAHGVRFTPDYTVRYESNGKDSFSWSTVSGNPRATGHGKCRVVSDTETEVEYHESITADIPVPRLIAPLIRKIVSEKIASGVDRYLDRMIREVEGR